MTKQHTEPTETTPSDVLRHMADLIAKQQEQLANAEQLYRTALITHYLGYPIGTDEIVVRNKPITSRATNLTDSHTPVYLVYLTDDTDKPITEVNASRLYLMHTAARNGKPMQLPAEEIAKRFRKRYNFGGEV